MALALPMAGMGMPALQGGRGAAGFRSADEGMRPDQDLHEQTKARLLALKQHAEKAVLRRHSVYDDLELLYLNYADPDVLADDGTPLNPQKRSIVVPATYAAIQTLCAHIYATWTARSVLLPLQAFPPTEDAAAEALEAVLEAKHVDDMTAVKLWGWLLDAFKYGRGAILPTWQTEEEDYVETVSVPLPGVLGGLLPPARVQRRGRRVKQEGPVNVNIPPRALLTDPSVPSWEPQRGRFVAMKSRRSFAELFDLEAQGIYFNVKAIPKSQPQGLETARRADSAVYGQTAYELTNPLATDDLTIVDLVSFWVKLIPQMWGLGDSRRTEIWVFVLANDAVIIRAEPLDNAHGKFPIAVMDSCLDVHAAVSAGHIELAKGIQEHIDFLYNTRQANIRLGLYMAFLYDPRFVEEADLLSTQPGLRMRLRGDLLAGQPRSMTEIVHQLDVRDVTASFLGDIGLQAQMLKQTLGAPDVLQGLPTEERHSATEMGGVIQHARTRAGQLGALMWGQGVVPWGMLEISDCQQYLSVEEYYRLSEEAARNWESTRGYALVGPAAVQGKVKVAPVDVTMPVGREQMGPIWAQLLMALAKSPLAAQYDLGGMFEQMAAAMGLKNIGDYRRKSPIQTQVMPDEELKAEVGRGNLVPTEVEAGPMAAALAGLRMGGQGG